MALPVLLPASEFGPVSYTLVLDRGNLNAGTDPSYVSGIVAALQELFINYDISPELDYTIQEKYVQAGPAGLINDEDPIQGVKDEGIANPAEFIVLARIRNERFYTFSDPKVLTGILDGYYLANREIEGLAFDPKDLNDFRVYRNGVLQRIE